MVEKAKSFATKAHEGQYRKGTATPYIVHPLEVAKIVASMTDDNEIIAAALLHDTVEDCPGITEATIEEHFGSRIANLVAHESEDKTLSWHERKSRTIERLNTASHEVQLIALGDKLSNIRDIARDYPIHGENLWMRFRMKDKAVIGWYYKGVLEALYPTQRDTAAFQEYTELVTKIFGA